MGRSIAAYGLDCASISVAMNLQYSTISMLLFFRDILLLGLLERDVYLFRTLLNTNFEDCVACRCSGQIFVAKRMGLLGRCRLSFRAVKSLKFYLFPSFWACNQVPFSNIVLLSPFHLNYLYDSDSDS